MTTIIKGMEWIGGRWWRCVKCQRTIAADCSCCQPPVCGCTAVTNREGAQCMKAAKVDGYCRQHHKMLAAPRPDAAPTVVAGDQVRVVSTGMFGRVTRVLNDGGLWVSVKSYWGNRHHAATRKTFKIAAGDFTVEG